MIPLYIPAQQHLKRRKALLSLFQPHSDIIVLFGSQLKQRNYDNPYPFRVDSDFQYLTGFAEPQAIALFWKDGAKSQEKVNFELFTLPRDPKREQWDGFRYGPNRAKKLTGADAAYSVDDFEERLHAWFASRKPGTATKVYGNFFSHPEFEQKLRRSIAEFSFHGRSGAYAPVLFGNTDLACGSLRLIKDQHEIRLLRESSRLNVEAHLELLNALKPGLYEFELQAILEGAFRKQQAVPAYQSICAGADRATVLHYNENDKRLKDGDLFLIDAGCEKSFYASDITRTYPVSGKFTKEQRNIFDIVAEAHQEACAQVRSGRPFKDIHTKACEVLVHGLCALKLLKKKPKEELKSDAFRRYYPHGTGHWMGLDTHDPCPYTSTESHPVKLAPGMVLTVEPGLYFMKNDKTVPTAYRGIGVRIEDDLLVTRSKAEVLTEGLPRYADEIEAYMKKRAL